ncbi:hypothetical protein DZJ_45720 [Dickeya ananatis]
MEAVDNHLNRQQWVFLASKTVLRWATSPGEPHGRGESPCRSGQKTSGTFLNSVYAGPKGEPHGWGE